MVDFLRFIDELKNAFPIHVEIYYSRVMDWCIKVYKKGCAADYPASEADGQDAILCNVQKSDIELAFAKAHVQVKEWLLENTGGY